MGQWEHSVGFHSAQEFVEEAIKKEKYINDLTDLEKPGKNSV